MSIKIAVALSAIDGVLFAQDPYAAVSNEVITLSIIALFLYVIVRLKTIFAKNNCNKPK